MIPLLLSVVLAVGPQCRADGHNQHRSRAAVKEFKAVTPCPKTCATYVRVGEAFVLYERCGACEVDHICPLACCGPDTAANMQWLDKKANKAKGDNCSSCRLQNN